MTEEKPFTLPPLEHEELLMVLNYATRLVILKPNMDLTVERVLETISDFAGGRPTALFLYNTETDSLSLMGTFTAGVYRRFRQNLPHGDTPLASVIRDKQYVLLPQASGRPYPFPAAGPCEDGRTCLCLPLAGVETRVIGILTVGEPVSEMLTGANLQMLMILATIGTLSIENTNLFHLATIDSLTGLFVRVLFDLHLREETARIKRYGGSAAAFIVDIDNFKKINDLYGHQQGDQVLRELASIIKRNIREDVDIPCRYGGDEFIVLISNTGREKAANMVERIQAACAAHPFSCGEEAFSVTISTGMVMIDSAGPLDMEEIVHRADQMLYQAKTTGKNRLCLWGFEGSAE